MVTLWNAELDLPGEDGRPANPDIPCNLLSMLKVRNDRLDWTQVLRSNDLILGVPHNVVQFTTLQEVVAGWLGVEVGCYVHISDSLHVYEHDFRSIEGYSKVASNRNGDSLSLPLPESQAAWRTLETETDRLIAADLTTTDFDRLLSDHDLPGSFGNLLSVLAADTARRRGWFDRSDQAIACCSNAALQQMWAGWAARAGRQRR